MEATPRQELVQGQRAAGDGDLLRAPGPFPVGNLLSQGLDQLVPHRSGLGARDWGLGETSPESVHVYRIGVKRDRQKKRDEGVTG